MILYEDVIAASEDAVSAGDVNDFLDAHEVDSDDVCRWAREFAAAWKDHGRDDMVEVAAVAGIEIGYRLALRQFERGFGL